MKIYAVLGLFLYSLSSTIQANTQDEDTGNVQINPIVIVEPTEEVREEYEAQIDTEFFEVGGYFGIIGIEDFRSEPIIGFKASFHATEDFFLQANFGKTEVGISAYEEQADASIVIDRDYSYYNLLVGYNLFPGESFITQGLTLNSTFYLVAGVGNTSLNKDDHFTITYGSGYRIILNDWLTWNMDFRNHSFESQILANKRRVNNLEFSIGLTAFF